MIMPIELFLVVLEEVEHPAPQVATIFSVARCGGLERDVRHCRFRDDKF